MRVCEGSAWGPWEYGMFTECFQQLTIMTAIALLVIVGGLIRLYQLTRDPVFIQPYGKVQVTKIVICALLGLLHVVGLVSKAVFVDWYWFQLAADLRDFICWALVTVVICLEMRRGWKHFWVIRAWWVLYYFGVCLLLQALRNGLYNDHWKYIFFDFLSRFILAAVVVVLGLWVKEGKIEEEKVRLLEKEKKEASIRQFGTLSLLEVDGINNPYEGANIFSKYLYFWPGSLVALGNRRTIDFSDLWMLSTDDKAEVCVTKLAQAWYLQLDSHKPSLFKALWSVHRRRWLLAALGKLIEDIAKISAPLLLYYLLRFLEDKSAPISTGLYLVAAIFLASLIQSLSYNFTMFLGYRIAHQIRAALTAIVYRKATTVDASEKAKFSPGEIINYQSTDANRVATIIPLSHALWSTPLRTVVCMFFIYEFVGYAMFAGLITIIILIPLNIVATGRMAHFQEILLEFRDKRIRIMAELLSGIRLIKFFNWEKYFGQRVNAARDEEIGHQKLSAYALSIVMYFVSHAIVLVGLAIFITYALMGNILTPEVVFPTLALLNSLKVPLGFIPVDVTGVVEMVISLRRIQGFLVAEEMNPNSVETGILPEDEAIRIEKANFKWRADEERETLENISLSVKKGELVAVVGTVGSGKSSLLAALLGEINKTSGRVFVNGSIAYVPQQAWMQNTSLRANILFGKPYEDAKYSQCLSCCELLPDIKILPNGDMTEIGEKGINLSGGQKQRISLARAMYQGASIYLLDSPLSAVDPHVGTAIFNNMLTGALAQTTRIFVTHQLDLLHRADKIVVMHHGKIAEMGTYDELMNSGMHFAGLVNKYVGEQKEKEEQDEEEAKKATGKEVEFAKSEGLGNLIEEEVKEEGAIALKIYKLYLKSGGYFFTSLAIFFFLAESAGSVATDTWLSEWSTALSNDRFYILVYVGIVLGTGVVILIRSVSMVHVTISAAKKLHDTMFARIMRAPMSFFDTTPVGRILNRFSRDTANIDSNLPTGLAPLMASGVTVVTVFVVVCFVTPFFLVPLLPLVYLFYFLYWYYMTTSREVMRLDSVSKSPIYALFSETLSGMSTIRAFQRVQDFIDTNNYKIDRNLRALYVLVGILRWFSLRFEFLCNAVVTLAALFCVLEKQSLNPALAGLSITYAMQLTEELTFFLLQYVEVETNVISVERVAEYSDIPTEGSHEPTSTRVPENWPEKGEIVFQDFCVRYREGLGLVLKGITAKINPSEKIGIVGRTGAGKSSMLLALFRLVEAASGAIYIDSIDISKIGLADLRSRMAIIPQDPVLFTGTVRSNMDPFEHCTDTEIWNVLESVHMKYAIEILPGKLDCLVQENGDNFSVGQRQLLCLGRALLRKAKILLLDEATASVDIETDALIQRTIREKFVENTVLTIAHRINTILDSDRVMVLDHGRVVEFDTPQELSNNPNSIFYSLLQESQKNRA
eukprot:Phypoly_transcript_00552.p1 GENE.Phypoly_transcript_00552~~Phypoly_transcript_00552.p1  ORF type:complete len:1441 (-),score=206.09 Phypoly_transcript_00552:79-4401(-)